MVGELAHHLRRLADRRTHPAELGLVRPRRGTRRRGAPRRTPAPTNPRHRDGLHARRVLVRRWPPRRRAPPLAPGGLCVSITVGHASIVSNCRSRTSRICGLIQYENWTSAVVGSGYVRADAGLRKVLSRLDGCRRRRRSMDSADPARVDPGQHPVQRHCPWLAGHLPIAARPAVEAPRTQGRPRTMAGRIGPRQRVPPDSCWQGPGERRLRPRRVVRALAVQRDGTSWHRSDHADLVDAPPHRPLRRSRPAGWSCSSTTRRQSGSRRGSCSIAARPRCATSTPATTVT